MDGSSSFIQPAKLAAGSPSLLGNDDHVHSHQVEESVVQKQIVRFPSNSSGTKFKDH